MSLGLQNIIELTGEIPISNIENTEELLKEFCSNDMAVLVIDRPTDFYLGTHHHDSYEFTITYTRLPYCQIDKKIYDMPKNTLFSINPMQNHGFAADAKNVKLCGIHISKNFLSTISASLYGSSKILFSNEPHPINHDLNILISLFFSIPVFAAPSISLNKTEFTPGENVEATIQGVSAQAIEDGAWVGYADEDIRYENTEWESYVYDLPKGNLYKFEAPSRFGKYEVRVLNYGDGSLIAKASFTVAGSKAKAGDIKLSNTEVLINQPMSVTVSGLTQGQIDDGAWVGVVPYDNKLSNTEWESYISDLDKNNTYKFTSPSKFGRYEVRVFTKMVSGEKEHEAALFGKAEFIVVSSKAKPGDIVISKNSVQPEELMTLTVKGLTPGEIEAGAWVGIAKFDEKLENTQYGEYISGLKAGNVYEFKAPYEPGKYEARVFCKYGFEDPAEYEYGMFGKVEFLVSGSAAPSTGYLEGYEGLHSWHVEEVNIAKQLNLVTDKVMTDFPKDITREEFCELAVLLFEKLTATKAAAATNPFSDTNNAEILKAYKLGIVAGKGEGKFAPNDKVTRQEMSAMLVRTLKATKPNIDTKAEFKTKFQDEREIGNWALGDVRFMNAYDIIKGSDVGGVSYILPKGNTTREQAIALVLRIYNTFGK